MDKNSTLFPYLQDEKVISFSKTVRGKKIKVDFDAPDLSSNGGLLFASASNCGFIDKISACIPDCRNPFFIQHTIRDMVRQRVGQITCGYEDANDCDALRQDSALKMMAGRLPSDHDLCSQPTMTRLENRVGIRTLYQIGQLFVEEFVRSFNKAPKRIILDVDDTNANTYGNQQLTLFNDYYGESCYMPTLMYDGLTGKMILPILRPGRRNKSVNIFGILRRVVEYLHQCWSGTIIELRGDSHFCSHEFMDWIKDAKRCYVCFTTGLSGNHTLLNKIEKQKKRAENDFKKTHKDVRRYFDFYYKAKSWKYEQRVVAKIEVNAQGTNIRFVVTSNRNNRPETIYQRYCGRGLMELWIKDLKGLRGDRMSCNKFKANQFRLFLYAAAYMLIHKIKHDEFRNTPIERFTIESFIQRIMLSAVLIKENKSYIKISFVKGHRQRDEMRQALKRIAA